MLKARASALSAALAYFLDQASDFRHQKTLVEVGEGKFLGE